MAVDKPSANVQVSAMMDTLTTPLDTGYPVQLSVVGKIMQQRIQERLMTEGVTIVDPPNTWIDARAEIGQDAAYKPRPFFVRCPPSTYTLCKRREKNDHRNEDWCQQGSCFRDY